MSEPKSLVDKMRANTERQNRHTRAKPPRRLRTKVTKSRQKKG
jgi:hypothetical protein